MSKNDMLEIINRSDVGQVRPHNEDSTVTDDASGLVIVADGMGGYKAGEVASAIAVSTLLTDIRDALAENRTDTGGGSDNDSGEPSTEARIIENAIIAANKLIFKSAKHQPQCQGMGTTVVLGQFHDDKITIAHVGDSRMYRFRDNELQQITSDHSVYQELIDRGLYTAEEADVAVNKNLVTRALGIEAQVEVDVRDETIIPGDIYLLCSDGLSDMVKDHDISLTLRDFSANLEQAADELIRLANENGGKDNISVVLARPLKPFSAQHGKLGHITKWFS